jgi:hypothetical protein
VHEHTWHFYCNLKKTARLKWRSRLGGERLGLCGAFGAAVCPGRIADVAVVLEAGTGWSLTLRRMEAERAFDGMEILLASTPRRGWVGRSIRLGQTELSANRL